MGAKALCRPAAPEAIHRGPGTGYALTEVLIARSGRCRVCSSIADWRSCPPARAKFAQGFSMPDWFRKQPKIVKSLLAGYPTSSPTPVLRDPVRSPLPQPKPGQTWTAPTAPTAMPEAMQGVCANVVKHHFTRSEIRFISKEEERLHGLVFEKLKAMPPFDQMSDNGIVEAIKQITFRLQQSDLTINFKSSGFFSRRNKSVSYQQMYERGVYKGEGSDGEEGLRMTYGNALNPSDVRDTADTRVMFRPGVGTGSTEGIGRFMQTGGLVKDGADFKVTNKNFNAKTRQTFAALNWGRCPTGAARDYGSSHMVLSDRFKQNAMYYMGDTFDSGATAANRATYGLLFALILWAKPAVVKGIIHAGWYGQRQDWAAMGGHSLLEAHIYEEVRFKGGVKRIVVHEMDAHEPTSTWILNGRKGKAPPSKEDIVANAKRFCRENDIELKVIPING